MPSSLSVSLSKLRKSWSDSAQSGPGILCFFYVFSLGDVWPFLCSSSEPDFKRFKNGAVETGLCTDCVAGWILKCSERGKLGETGWRRLWKLILIFFFFCHSYFLALTSLPVKWLVPVNIQWMTREIGCLANELLFEVIELKMKPEVVLDTVPFQLSQNTNITTRILSFLFFFFPPSSLSPSFKREIFGWNLVIKN